jgi:hypothetical protein
MILAPREVWQPGLLLAMRNRLNQRVPGEAEGEGFEPSIRLTTDNGFRDRRIRPLCHPSTGSRGRYGAEKEGFEPSREVFTPLTP